MPNASHFKTPKDIIQDYYRQKPTKRLVLARGNKKPLLRQLYLEEHWLELYLYEMARKNSGFCNGSNGTQLERKE